MKILDKDFIKLVEVSFSKYDILRKLGMPLSGNSSKKIQKRIDELNLDTSHFLKNGSQPKYTRVIKNCPVCNKEFEIMLDHPRAKTTCSFGCSNTFFRSGKNNGSYKDPEDMVSDTKYRKICFNHHEKKCIICGETNIVSVHHYDKDHNNNNPKNLIPLCPTHHQYLHSRFEYLIKDKVQDYINNWTETNGA